MAKLLQCIAGLAVAVAIVPALAAPQKAAPSDEATALNAKVIELYQAGKYSEAIPLAQQLLSIREKTLGADHPDVATALNNLARLYQEQGRYAEAEPLLKRILATREKALGPDDPNVATALNDLASLYDDEGRYTEAEPLFKRSLRIREKVLGLDHSSVAESLINLGDLYREEGRYAEAEPLLKRGAAIQEKTRGSDHPDVARALNDLQALYQQQGRYTEAEPLLKRILAIREKALGPDHPDVATALNNLASLSYNEGHYAEAEPLLKRSLGIREKGLRPDHPLVAQSLSNLAALYNNESRYSDAEPLLKRAVAISEKTLGPAHPNVATALNNLAHLYSERGGYKDAEPLFKRSLAIWEKALGPDHPDVATAVNNLAHLYGQQGRYADAEELYERSLATRERTLGLNHPRVGKSLTNLAALYYKEGSYEKALPLIRTTISHKAAPTTVALQVLFAGQAEKLIRADEAFDDSLNVVRRAVQTSAGAALNALAVRFSIGTGRLAELVRKDQDLASEATNLDKAIVAALSKEPSRRDAAAEQKIRGRIATIAHERDELGKVFAREFPDYAALSRPEPLTVKEIRPLLADDEAIVIVDLGASRSYVWVISRSAADWKELTVTAGDVSREVSALRTLLGFDSTRTFDTRASFDLYRQILAPIEEILSGKSRLSFVVNGALTSLPPQVLVTNDPEGTDLASVDWLVRRYAITVLPSVASLKILRGKNTIAAVRPLLGYADPIFDRSTQPASKQRAATFNQSLTNFYRGMTADTAALAKALPALPETADELRAVAAKLGAKPEDVKLGKAATVANVKHARLDDYRVVYFATHALVAGEVEKFAKAKAEPALVLSIPDKPSNEDDGLLRASDVAMLKMNADFVVLSACNTAAGDRPGAEALSGLARAFFYAGARSLIVSNWEVDSDATVAVMTGLFNAVKKDPHLSHAEALRLSMLKMIDNPSKPEWAQPKYWAPFVVVGEPQRD